MAEKQKEQTIESLIASTNDLQPELDAKAQKEKEAQRTRQEAKLAQEKAQIEKKIAEHQETFKAAGIGLSVVTERNERGDNDYTLKLEKGGVIQEVTLPGFNTNEFSGISTDTILKTILDGVKKGGLNVEKLQGNNAGRKVSIGGNEVGELEFATRKGHPDFQSNSQRWEKPGTGYYAWLDNLQKAINGLK